MSFKESYKKDYENIKTDKAFRERLSAEMNAAHAPEKRGKMQFAVCAAAVIALAAGLSFLALPKNEKEIISEQAGTGAAVSAETGLLAPKKWYSGAETDEEIWAEFRKLISAGDITSLYMGSGETLKESDILTSDDTEELCRRLSGAVPCESAELSGEISFCMAVFGDGKIVKFRISSSGEVQLNDAELICRFE